MSNLIVRDLYNRFRETVWAVDYEMPRQEPAYMYNRKSGVRHYPAYDTGGNVRKYSEIVWLPEVSLQVRPWMPGRAPQYFRILTNVLHDYGVISRIVNPYAKDEHIICAAGATGLGTRVALEFLADPGSSPEFLKHFEKRRSVQLMFSAEPSERSAELLDVCHG